VAALDWPELREAVAACTACALCKSRRQTVFGVGNQRAHWMIVGEAPGEQEDIQGEPFVGKSGQLLDNMLRAIGRTRGEAAPEQQVYIANTLKCRPPGNRNPLPDELEKCEGFLIRQLQLVQPKVILAMGAFAAQSLLRSTDPVGACAGACTSTGACRWS
jgi:DNA polymerase